MATDTKLGSYKIVAFVATTKPAEAKAFYRDTLGLPLVSEDPFAIVFDAQRTMLRVSIVKEVAIGGYTVLGWDVPDAVAAAITLEKAGVAMQRYPGMNQDAHGIWTAPSGAKVGWFKDPDGNTLSLTEF